MLKLKVTQIFQKVVQNVAKAVYTWNLDVFQDSPKVTLNLGYFSYKKIAQNFKKSERERRKLFKNQSLLLTAKFFFSRQFLHHLFCKFYLEASGTSSSAVFHGWGVWGGDGEVGIENEWGGRE